MPDNLQLKYRRVGEEYVGTITLGVQTLVDFKTTYAEMMKRVHIALHPLPAGTEVVITRLDRDGLLPVKLEPKLLALLKWDLLGFIRANTLPDRVIDLTEGKKASKLVAGEKYEVPKNTGLRHGHDTLAAAFGERVYVSMRRREGSSALYEHPATGRWADYATIAHWLGTHATEEVFAVDSKRGWLTIPVTDLLNTDASRFYLPREWNSHGNWITDDQLRTKYEQFIKERNDVTRK